MTNFDDDSSVGGATCGMQDVKMSSVCPDVGYSLTEWRQVVIPSHWYRCDADTDVEDRYSGYLDQTAH